MKPIKENTLYLPIRKVYFDEIIAGTKTTEYREIKDTTAKRYLLTNDQGRFIPDPNVPGSESCEYIDDYNGGRFPYFPRPYKYLSLAVGYAKERDTAIVEVVGYSFEPHIIRGNRYAFWVIAYHLGRIAEVKRKRGKRCCFVEKYTFSTP